MMTVLTAQKSHNYFSFTFARFYAGFYCYAEKD